MTDITPAHELLGKVVVVLDLQALPTDCFTCPYLWSWGENCLARGRTAEIRINISEGRMDNCPLRIVGR